MVRNTCNQIVKDSDHFFRMTQGIRKYSVHLVGDVIKNQDTNWKESTASVEKGF